MPETEVFAPLFDTFLVGASGKMAAARAERLQAGMLVTLRADQPEGRWPRFDVLDGTGGLLGNLPPEDASSLRAMSGRSATLSGEITALVPTRLGSRVHLRVSLPV